MSQRQPFAPSRPTSRAAHTQDNDSQPLQRVTPTSAVPATPPRLGQSQQAQAQVEANGNIIPGLSTTNRPLKTSTLRKNSSQTLRARPSVDSRLQQHQRPQPKALFQTSPSSPHIFASPPLPNAHIAAPTPTRTSPPFVANGLFHEPFKMPALPQRRVDRSPERTHTGGFTDPVLLGSPTIVEDGSAQAHLTASTDPAFYGAPASDDRFNVSPVHAHAQALAHADEVGAYDEDEMPKQAERRTTAKRPRASTLDFNSPDPKRARAAGGRAMQDGPHMPAYQGGGAPYRRAAPFAPRNDDGGFAAFEEYPPLKPPPPGSRRGSIAVPPPPPRDEPVPDVARRFNEYCTKRSMEDEEAARWENCTDEEWVQGSEEIREKFDKALGLVTGQMTKTLAVYAGNHDLVKAHHSVLDGREQMMIRVQRSVMHKSGHVLVVEEERETDG